MEVALDKARAQRMGASFQPRRDDAPVAAALLGGRLTLQHHGPTTLADEPTWAENPFDDNNWQFQFHTLRWLDVLRRVGERGDEESLRRYEQLLRSWVDAHERCVEVSPFSWDDMGTAQRAIGFVHAVVALGPQDWLVAALQHHGALLADDDFYARSHYNHSLHQILGLVAVGATLGRQDWVSTAVSRLEVLVLKSVDEQGVTDEGSTEYQKLNYRWYREAVQRVRAAGAVISPSLQRIDRMTCLLADATRPDGRYEMIGDSSDSAADPFPDTWAEYAATRGTAGSAPPRTFAVYDRGYVFGRSGWGTERDFADEWFYCLRFGDAKASHSHEDIGALTLHAAGRQHLYDAGKFAYGGSAIRRYVRSRASHNVVDVPGRKYRRDVRAELLMAAGGDAAGDTVAVEAPVLTGVRWRRAFSVDYESGWILLVDLVDRETEGSVVQRWHLGEDREVHVDDQGAHTIGEGSNLSMLWPLRCPAVGVVVGQEDPPMGWRSYKYRQVVQHPVVEAQMHCTAVALPTLLVVRPPGVTPADLVVLEAQASVGGLRVRIRCGYSTRTLVLALPSEEGWADWPGLLLAR